MIFYRYGGSSIEKISPQPTLGNRKKIVVQKQNSPKKPQSKHFKSNNKIHKPKPTVSDSLAPSLRQKDISQLQGTLKQYYQIKNKVISSIPSKDTIKSNAKQNPHSLPSALILAGKELGKYKKIILQYPDNQEVQKDAQTFYQQCASQESYPNSIRSLCLYNRTILSKNKGEKFDTSTYPEAIRKVLIKR